MTFCETIQKEQAKKDSQNSQFISEDDFDGYEGMTYVEIEKKLKQLQELDDRYEEEDRILESW